MTTLIVALFLVTGFCQMAIAGDIYLHMLTTGQPADTKLVGDTLGSPWYVNFEVGQATWDTTDVGIGPSTDGTSWDWGTAVWYEDGSGSNKRVRRDIGNIRFTSAGSWYFAGRAKADPGDAWHYANDDQWGNVATLSASYYFTITALSNPSISSVAKGSTYPNSTVDLSWTPWNPGSGAKDVMIVRRKGLSVAWTPSQGTAYVDDQNLGNDTYVVLASDSGTTHADSDLEAGVTYYYKFYTVNNDYYSGGVEDSVSLDDALVKATFNGYDRSGLDGQSDGTTDLGLSGTWSASNATLVAETTMTYEGGDISVVGITNGLTISRFASGREMSATRSLAVTIPKTTPVLYVGFLAQFNNSLNSSDYAYIALDEDDSTSTQLGVGFDYDTGGDFKVWVGGTSENGGPVDVIEGQAYYVIAKFLGGTEGTGFTNATVFVNPTNTLLEQAEYVFGVTNGSGFAVDLSRMNMWHYLGSGSDSYNFDQITIGTTWAEVAYSNSNPTVVVLYSFTAATEDEQVVVRWRTASESDTAGFTLYRQDTQGDWQPVNSQMILAKGISGMGASYSLVDADAEVGGTYTYKLVEQELSGGTEEYGPYERTASELVITSPMRPVDGGFELRWLSRQDEWYTILRSENLVEGFNPIATQIPATPPENTYLDNTDSAQAFYRIEVEQE